MRLTVLNGVGKYGIGVCLCLGMLSACTGEGITAPHDNGYRSIGGGEEGIREESPLAQYARLKELGCSLSDERRPSARVVPITDRRTGLGFFVECPTSARGLVRIALQGRRLQREGQANLMGGEWVSVSREWCHVTGGEWIDGLFYLGPGDVLYDCAWYDTVIFVPSGSPQDYPSTTKFGGFPTGTGGGSTSGAPIVTPATPPPSDPSKVLRACTEQTPESLDTWAAATPQPFDPEQADIPFCLSSACMAASPGIWIGTWPLNNGKGVGAGPLHLRHTAIASVPPMEVTELVGWTEELFNTLSQGPTPHYGGQQFGSYLWIRVAGTDKQAAVTSAIAAASLEVMGDLYLGGSNRFIAAILSKSDIYLGPEQKLMLGNAVGICSCGRCPD